MIWNQIVGPRITITKEIDDYRVHVQERGTKPADGDEWIISGEAFQFLRRNLENAIRDFVPYSIKEDDSIGVVVVTYKEVSIPLDDYRMKYFLERLNKWMES